LLAEQDGDEGVREGGNETWHHRLTGSGSATEVDENAIRFSNYFHLLRELVHSPRAGPAGAAFQVKYALADHLHDERPGDQQDPPASL
jgi:hypothetical protein